MVNRGPGMLQILQASINTTGEYSCVVTNKFGSKTRTYQLEVIKGKFVSLVWSKATLSDSLARNDTFSAYYISATK